MMHEPVSSASYKYTEKLQGKIFFTGCYIILNKSSEKLQKTWIIFFILEDICCESLK